MLLCTAARVCISTHPERHWPACYDQTCGYPGDGPMTSLDSLDALGACLTPTQEILTCDMVKCKTMAVSGPLMERRVCGKILARRFEGRKCKNCYAWACSAACARGVVDSHCCRMSGVSSIVSQSRACSQGVGGSGDAGSRELTQETEWVTDVQKKDEQVEDVPCDRSRLCERVAFRAELHPLPLPPCWQHPWRLRRKDPCRLIWRLREQAKGNCNAALRPRTLHLVGGEAVAAGDVVAGDAYHQAPASRPEAKNVCKT